MFKFALVAFLFHFCIVTSSLPCGQDWSSLAGCLQMDATQTSSDDILKFIRHEGYMIVPPSNPPSKTPIPAPRRGKRAVGTNSNAYTGKCPYQFQVKDFIDTVPRFVSNATCQGCDVRCKPVVFTQRLLRKHCQDFWLWEEHDVRVAYYLDR